MNLLSSSYSSSYCDRIDREEFENRMSETTDTDDFGDCKFSVCGVDVGNLFLFDLKKNLAHVLSQPTCRRAFSILFQNVC